MVGGRLHGQRQHSLTAFRHLLNALLPIIAIERRFPVSVHLAAAHIENALRRALGENKPGTRMIVMQGGHEAVLGLERNNVGTRARLAFEFGVVPGFHGQYHQGALGWIAIDSPLPGVLVNPGIAAQQRRPRHLGEERPMPRRLLRR